MNQIFDDASLGQYTESEEAEELNWEKEAFLIEYVLNRAKTTNDALGGEQAAQQACLAWEFIRQQCD